ncbi:MAG TPA: hypothetical protein VNW97_15750 [Candidatus Saccharimonadales bacterium]|nr:hypothetical protein [Candidatus Saccharimonadales bacterium]
MAGYSKRSLVDKLGIKPAQKFYLGNPPKDYAKTLGNLPAGALPMKTLNGPCDFIQFFTSDLAELRAAFPRLKKNLTPSGSLWISWPKAASKVKTDVNENLVRGIGLEQGLVDVKVCAVDDVWSGLKFVYRLKDR